MTRRQMLAAGTLAAAAPGSAQSNRAKFRLRYGPHPGMFNNLAGEDIIDQIKFSADQGFTGWEDNGAMRREPDMQEKIAKALGDRGMKMGVFVSYNDFKTSDFVTKTTRDFQDKLRAEMKTAVEAAKRLNAKWTTIVPGVVSVSLDPGYQLANCIANLKVMCEVCEPSGLVMVMEPLNWYRDHPGLYLRSVPQGYGLCKAVNSPSCKILDDLYHQQIDVGNLIPNMEKAWDEIAYIQVGDNPGRKEPGTGEIHYKGIFRWLHQKKYDGVVGMEHGNSKPGKEGELAVIAAYRECDSF
ncbi:MAG: TIM barrel protein [Acidobacteria bacterium]|nr:TIM barrel protein [Acidobacteriota bacterium]